MSGAGLVFTSVWSGACYHVEFFHVCFSLGLDGWLVGVLKEMVAEFSVFEHRRTPNIPFPSRGRVAVISLPYSFLWFLIGRLARSARRWIPISLGFVRRCGTKRGGGCGCTFAHTPPAPAAGVLQWRTGQRHEIPPSLLKSQKQVIELASML